MSTASAATVVFTLLDAPATTGCRFAYHGDFDGPGIALANWVVRCYEARPCCMSTADYERLAARSQTEGILQLALNNQPISADWDPDLAPRHDRHRRRAP